MPEIKNVLVTAYLKPENQARLRAALAPAEVRFILFTEKQRIAEAVRTADVCILQGDLDDSILAGQNLQWIHCCRAGVEKSARPDVFERGIILTSSSGRSAPALAEHALMFMMALTYDLPMLLRAQAAHQWAVSREYFEKTGLYGKTVGILGLGKTGCEVARLCKGFDMRVLGWRRGTDRPEHVDELFSAERGDDLKPLLSRSDYLVLCVELNDDTWHLLGAEQLAAMKPSAHLVNMGRGSLIDEPALIAALQNGRLAGAGLDTFETEPLPDASPLWDLPNVIITPHITPQLPDREERMLSYVYENIRVYREGGTFVNRVTRRNMLTKDQADAKADPENGNTNPANGNADSANGNRGANA